MSDPLTNLEIQDVLSSIRRLVSEDNRHRAERERGRDGARASGEVAPTGAPAPAPGDVAAGVSAEVASAPPAEVAAEVAADGLTEVAAAEVAADGLTQAAAETAAEAPAGASVEPGKLFLTEALRVAVPEAAPAEDAQTASPPETGATAGRAMPGDIADIPTIDLDATVTGDARFEAGDVLPAVAEAEAAGDDTWEPAEADPSLEGTVAGLEAAVAGIGGEFEPDGSEVMRGAAIDAELEEAFEEGFPVDTADEDDMALLSQPVTAPAPVVTPAAAGTREGEGEDAEVLPDETLAADAAAEAAPDGHAPEDAAHRDGGDVAVDHFDLAAPEAGGDAPGAADASADDREDGTPEASADAAAASMIPAFVHSGPAKVFAGGGTGDGAPRAAAARRLTLTAAEAVPEGPAPWDRADAPASEPDAEAVSGDAPGLASALADDADAASAAGEDDRSIFGPSDEGVIDMDMLRDLVAEIIREELQGPLGERITRNVRMLVRREINRALEARGLE